MSQVVGYDLTLPVNEEWHDEVAVFAYIAPWASKYSFQKEKGDSGYIHWQIRLRLIKKRTKASLLQMGFGKGGHLSITSKAVHTGKSFNYVLKADSRIDGPWTEAEYKEAATMTRQLGHYLKQTARPWQRFAEKLVTQLDDRYITLIYDTVGNSGKSIFCEHMEYKRLATEIPPFRSMEDIMQCVMSMPVAACYLVDMPRGMKKSKLGEFYAGLEVLKNGAAYDKRYSFHKKRFDRPQILVFSNALPVFDLLTPDRWKIYEMQSDYSMIPYQEQEKTYHPLEFENSPVPMQG